MYFKNHGIEEKGEESEEKSSHEKVLNLRPFWGNLGMDKLCSTKITIYKPQLANPFFFFYPFFSFVTLWDVIYSQNNIATCQRLGKVFYLFFFIGWILLSFSKLIVPIAQWDTQGFNCPQVLYRVLSFFCQKDKTESRHRRISTSLVLITINCFFVDE